VHDPVLLFLDEPTTGLDPQARRNFWDLVTRIKQAGKTIVLTTHYMDEAYALCDRIAIMDHGHVIAEGTPRSLLAEHFADVVLELPAQAVEGRELGLPMVHKGEVVEIVSQSVNDAVTQLLAAGVELSRLHIRPRSLEDLFITLTGRELRG
jgi:ABC-2 type transport system ATP-binding protein